MASALLPALVRCCTTAAPEITIAVVDVKGAGIETLFTEEVVDICLCWGSDAGSGFESEQILSSSVVCAANPAHPLARGQVHDGRDLLQFPRAIPPAGDGIRVAADRWWLETTGEELCAKAFVASSYAAAAEIAAMSVDHLAFLPVATMDAYRLVPLRIAASPITVTIRAAYSTIRRQRRAVDDLLRLFHAMAAEWTGELEAPAAPLSAVTI